MKATMFVKAEGKAAVRINNIMSAEFGKDKYAVTVPWGDEAIWLTLATQGNFTQINMLGDRTVLSGPLNDVLSFTLEEA